MDITKERERIVNFLREKLKEEGKDGYIVGVSGGIDSCVVSYLLKEAVGREKVFALIMPEMDTESSSTKDALFIVQTLGIPYKVFSLTKALWVLGVYKIIPLWLLLFKPLKRRAVRYLYTEYSKILGKPVFFAVKEKLNVKLNWFYEGIAYHRIKHRLRMSLLYFFAEKKNYLVVGCANLTEALIGYYVRYGDDSCDIAPISHLYKTEVRELAKILEVPKRIIEKSPSPDLLPGITDEYSIGIDYYTLDRILQSFEEGKDPSRLKEFDEKLTNLIYEQYLWAKEQIKKPLKLLRG
ncbi:MAG: NAD(+) synthase [Dictyoglomaceae bacterium]